MPAKGKKQRLTQSARAGLTFPVARLHRMMKVKFGKGRRVSKAAGAYLAAIMEYMSAELLEIAGNCARDLAQKRLRPRHIKLAVCADEEMSQFLRNVTMPSAGVFPSVHTSINAKKPLGKAAATVVVNKTTKTTKAKAGKGKAKAANVTLTNQQPAMTASGQQLLKQSRQNKGGNAGITTLSERALVNGQKLTVLSGDIVNIQSDAIIIPSSANYSLGGQVGQRVSTVGGATFSNYVRALSGSITTTNAAICQGHNFSSPYVIFCNGPSWSNNTQSVDLLTKTVHNCLAVADANQLKTIAFPSIGSGVGNFPKHTAAATILHAISSYFKQHTRTTLTHVYFVLYDQQSVNVYVQELGRMHE